MCVCEKKINFKKLWLNIMKSGKMYCQSNLNTASYPKQGVFD